MLKQIFNYMVNKKWSGICDDLSKYRELSRNARKLYNDMHCLRQNLIVDVEGDIPPEEKQACIIVKQIPVGYSSSEVEQTVPIFFYCARFSPAHNELPCKNTQCKYNLLNNEYAHKLSEYNTARMKKEAFWSERLQNVK